LPSCLDGTVLQVNFGGAKQVATLALGRRQRA
jgi:hypothetical protein